MRVIRDENTKVACEDLSDQEVRIVLDNLLAWLGLMIRFRHTEKGLDVTLLKGSRTYRIV